LLVKRNRSKKIIYRKKIIQSILRKNISQALSVWLIEDIIHYIQKVYFPLWNQQNNGVRVVVLRQRGSWSPSVSIMFISASKQKLKKSGNNVFLFLWQLYGCKYAGICLKFSFFCDKWHHVYLLNYNKLQQIGLKLQYSGFLNVSTGTHAIV